VPLDFGLPFDLVPRARGAEGQLPYIGHIAPDVVLQKNGAVMTMGVMPGRPHELASFAERNGSARQRAGLWKLLAAENLTVCAHFVRRRVDNLPPGRSFRNPFSADLFDTYRERVLRGRMYVNEWILSVILTPRLLSGAVVSDGTLGRMARTVNRTRLDSERDLRSALESIWATLAGALQPYGLRRLGLREENGALFSEIGEALRLILYCDPLPVPLVSGHLGNAIYTDRVIFGPRQRRFGPRQRRIFKIEMPDRERWGALLGLREYPDRTRPGMFDPILSCPAELVLAQSYSYLARHAADRRLAKQARHMVNAGDRALSQLEDIHRVGGALDQLMSGAWHMGTHSLALTIFSDDREALPGLAAMARTMLAGSGAVVVEESDPGAMEPAFWAQLPGNLEWQPRPGAVTTVNWAHLAEFSAFPAGAPAGRWGPAMLRFRTTAGTALDFIPHTNEDVGMMFIPGNITSGKSTLLAFLLAMFDQYMVDHAGRIFLFDKDRGSEIAVNAMGGRYLRVKAGQDSGLNPLRGLSDTPADRAFLVQWVRALIQLDEQGQVAPEDEARIARGVAAILRRRPVLRSLAGLRQFLGWRAGGAGARLERWCRGGSLGWCFDGEHDEVDLDAGIVGFDLTDILGDALIANPAALYLLHRIRTVMDGRRLVLALDEFRKYVMHAEFREMVEDYLLTARKRNALAILVTQEPVHVLRDTFGATLVDACQTLFIFPTPDADEAIYCGTLGLSEGELRVVREDLQPGSRRVLIKRKGETAESAVIDFDLSAMMDHVAVLSGRENTAAYAARLRREDEKGWLRKFMASWKAEARD
jgi:type IV secretion system protein VirB4